MSITDINLINRMNKSLGEIEDLAALKDSSISVDFLHHLLNTMGREEPGLHAVLEKASKRQCHGVDRDSALGSKIIDILALQPSTVLLMDPAGLRDSYSSWASFYRESFTVICRDSWQGFDAFNGSAPLVAKETSRILGKEVDGRNENPSRYQGCFDLVLGFHEGVTNLARELLPLLSARGIYLEIFIDKFHASEVTTIYNRSELKEALGLS